LGKARRSAPPPSSHTLEKDTRPWRVHRVLADARLPQGHFVTAFRLPIEDTACAILELVDHNDASRGPTANEVAKAISWGGVCRTMASAAVMAITKWSISSVRPTVLSRRVAAYPFRAGSSRCAVQPKPINCPPCSQWLYAGYPYDPLAPDAPRS
jgi:hypothetical protein